VSTPHDERPGDERPGDVRPNDERPPKRRSGQLADVHVLRYVPSDSVVHRSWAGTKILAVMVLTLGLLLWPTWAAAGLALVVVLLAVLGAHLPRGVAPRLPPAIWILFLLGAAIALVAGGGKRVHLGPVGLAVGGLEVWARFSLIGIDLLLLAALMAWTTPLADLAPALARLAAPLRRLKVPVDEIVGAIALAIRCLPLLMEEVRMVLAARRTRRPAPPKDMNERLELVEELLMAALHSALRRARELAEAIEARGGAPSAFTEPVGLGRADASCALVVVLATVGMGLLR
jgi:energy-coupling factor transporter transmembrane protein EcfT